MIGGNIKAIIQVRTTILDEIGVAIKSWEPVQELTGWLDLSNGESKYTVYDAKIQESSHLFICDYISLNKCVTSENSRAIIDGKIYDIKLIDDPMGLHEHLEIFLSYLGGES